MPITDEIQRVIMKNGTAVDIADIDTSKEGMVGFADCRLIKNNAGLTSLEEVAASTND